MRRFLILFISGMVILITVWVVFMMNFVGFSLLSMILIPLLVANSIIMYFAGKAFYQ